MISKKELKHIPYLDKRIDVMIEEVERLEHLVTNIKVLDPTKENTSGGDKDPTRLMDRMIDLKTEINTEIDRLLDLKSEAKKLLSGLDEREKLLMELRYLKRCSWEVVASEMNYSEKHIIKMHGVILQKLFKGSERG